jgi:hypothetical protein
MARFSKMILLWVGVVLLLISWKLQPIEDCLCGSMSWLEMKVQ